MFTEHNRKRLFIYFGLFLVKDFFFFLTFDSSKWRETGWLNECRPLQWDFRHIWATQFPLITLIWAIISFNNFSLIWQNSKTVRGQMRRKDLIDIEWITERENIYMLLIDYCPKTKKCLDVLKLLSEKKKERSTKDSTDMDVRLLTWCVYLLQLRT